MRTILQLLSQIAIDPQDLDIPDPAAPLDQSIETVLKIAFGLAGAISMIVIIIAGMMFILSRGDPQKSGVARNAIIYAAVGLAIMTAAFSIVSFVVGSV